jgi:hypothetical protein
MVWSETLDSRLAAAAGRLAAPFYVPVVFLGLAVQVVAFILRWPWLGMLGLGVAGIVELATSDERHPFRGRLRRIGLGLGQRVTVRALLLLGTFVGTDPGARVVEVYVLGMCLTILLARVHQRAFDLILREEPALGVANLGEQLAVGRFFVGARGRRLVGIGLLFAFEIPLALGLTLGTSSGSWRFVGFGVLVLTVLVQAAFVGVVVKGTRRVLTSESVDRYRRQLREELDELGPQLLVYFSGDADATYQLNQWMPVFERLEIPLLYVIRERIHLQQMHDTAKPVLYARRHREVEDAVVPSARVALYVGNAGRNVHLLRYPQLKHVFLNHGDSDKASSANPFVRAYDRLFVAGEVAIQRYADGGVPIPRERFAVVGRPQLDHVLDGRRKIDDGPTTLLYAPTWEGYFEATDYSSLERLGPAMIAEVLRSHPDVRIVFKPHPMSGLVRPGMTRARREVERLLRDAGTPHVVATDHPDLDLLAWFDRADVLLADVSAVVTDWLHTDKPYLLTNPRGIEVDEFHHRFPSHGAAYLVGPDEDLAGTLRTALGADPLAADRAAVKRKVLGDHPDGPFASFVVALELVVSEADRDRVSVRTTFSHG